MMTSSRLRGLATAVVLALSCATAARFAAPTAPLRIACNVADASVWIDDHLIAQVTVFAKTEKRLAVGFHRIEIRAPGYYSQFEEVEARPDIPIEIKASLRELLD
jgi:hypothetical protein